MKTVLSSFPAHMHVYGDMSTPAACVASQGISCASIIVVTYHRVIFVIFHIGMLFDVAVSSDTIARVPPLSLPMSTAVASHLPPELHVYAKQTFGHPLKAEGPSATCYFTECASLFPSNGR